MKKRFLSLATALCLILALFPAAVAAEEAPDDMPLGSVGAGTIADGIYIIQTTSGNKAIDNTGNSDWGAQFHLWDFDTANQNQVMNFQRQSDGTYKITAARSGLVWDVWGGHSPVANGTALAQYPWSGGNNQRWYITDVGGGQYRFSPKSDTGKAVDVTSGAFNTGTKLQLYDWSNSNGQKFSLVSAVPSDLAPRLTNVQSTIRGIGTHGAWSSVSYNNMSSSLDRKSVV